MDRNPINFPNVKNLINKIERLKLNKPTILRKKTKANTRKGWLTKANEISTQISSLPPSNIVSPFNLPEIPIYSINYTSANKIGNLKHSSKKPKYTFPYLIAKRQRGLNVTKKNRNTVRLQQLKNYIETSNNPRGKKTAKNEYNRISSQYTNNITRNLQ